MDNSQQRDSREESSHLADARQEYIAQVRENYRLTRGMVEQIYYQDGYTFRWCGGPYIDVLRDDEMAPCHALNVWDYGIGGPRIGPGEFVSTCQAWLDRAG